MFLQPAGSIRPIGTGALPCVQRAGPRLQPVSPYRRSVRPSQAASVMVVTATMPNPAHRPRKPRDLLVLSAEPARDRDVALFLVVLATRTHGAPNDPSPALGCACCIACERESRGTERASQPVGLVGIHRARPSSALCAHSLMRSENGTSMTGAAAAAHLVKADQ